jgi:metal-sulfur cluster biosynthetic enzyme
MAGEISRRNIIESLMDCVDPELGVSIVDLGLIYEITINENNDVYLRMTMTTPMCPVTGMILSDVQARLEALGGVGKVNVELVWDPMWSPEMLSDEIKVGML